MFLLGATRGSYDYALYNHAGGKAGIMDVGNIFSNNKYIGISTTKNLSCGNDGRWMSNGYNISDDMKCIMDNSDLYQSSLSPLPLANNGGSTLTAAINPSHPAYNFIPLSRCLTYPSDPLIVDQRGYYRPFGFKCDAGAYEIHK